MRIIGARYKRNENSGVLENKTNNGMVNHEEQKGIERKKVEKVKENKYEDSNPNTHVHFI